MIGGQEEVIRLWPDGAPTLLDTAGPEVVYRGPAGVAADVTLLRNVSDPTLTVYRPARPSGVGVVICPGGGWRILMWEHEGIEVARRLAAQGITAFLLKYRLGGTPPSPPAFEAEMAALVAGADLTRRGRRAPRAMSELFPASTLGARAAAADDGRRAVALVRARAGQWDVDPAKIGMMGFSVGGCLAVDVAIDPRMPPLAFVAPIYGGDTGRQVPTDAPPLFGVVAQDDVLMCRMVETLYAEWTDAEVSAELHIYRRGGHGFGLVPQGLPCDGWIDRFDEWLTDLGLR